MPNWKIHDKWAEKIGISRGISHLVNTLIDFPNEYQEFVEYCKVNGRIWHKGKITQINTVNSITHDMGRNKKFARMIQLNFLSPKRDDYIKAYYLHHMLDYISWWTQDDVKCADSSRSINEVILTDKHIEKKIGSPENPEIKAITKFIIENAEEVWQDCSGK